MVQHIIIAIAMEAEASPLIERLGLTYDDSIFRSNVVPFQAFSGYHPASNIPVTVITNGKDAVYGTAVDNCGTVPAALATHLALDRILFQKNEKNQNEKNQNEKNKEEGNENNDDDDHEGSDNNNNNKQKKKKIWLINAGTCGGFQRKTAQIGDVFVTTAVAHHDRRIPIPKFEEYGIGKLSFVGDHDNADESSNHENEKRQENEANDNHSSSSPSSFLYHLAQDLGYKLGVCSTGNSLDATDRDEHVMQHVNDASVKDMEAAAVAWVCAMHNGHRDDDDVVVVDFVGIKVVTDIVDGDRPTAEEFLQHLHTAAQSLQQAVPKVLDYLIDKTRTTTNQA